MASQAWTNYNNAINEGGEGYNPHSAEDDSGMPAWVVLDEKRARIVQFLSCTSYNDPRYAELEAQAAALEVAVKAAMAAQR